MPLHNESRVLTVYYDGLCHLCSMEIAHYQKLNQEGRLLFKDITEGSFDPVHEGVDPYLVHQVLHAKDRDGNILTGVDVFIAIWQELPRYQALSKVAKVKPVQAFLRIGYRGFAKVRPFLPRKVKSCEGSPYCDLKKS